MPILAPILTFLSTAWSLLSGAGKAVGSFFASLPRWLQIGIVASVALALGAWWLGQHEFDRGKAAQAKIDAPKLALCEDNVSILTAALRVQNEAVARFQAEAAQREKDDAARASAALKASDASRRREAARGSGAKSMNEFMSETFGGSK